jgi:hypothetical protein
VARHRRRPRTAGSSVSSTRAVAGKNRKIHHDTADSWPLSIAGTISSGYRKFSASSMCSGSRNTAGSRIRSPHSRHSVTAAANRNPVTTSADPVSRSLSKGSSKVSDSSTNRAGISSRIERASSQTPPARTMTTAVTAIISTYPATSAISGHGSYPPAPAASCIQRALPCNTKAVLSK